MFSLPSILGIYLSCLSFSAFSDQYHYNNVLVGDRAIGLGGAYAAVADDASGVVYNPAGLAFALSNDISGSANALYTRETIYKKTLGDLDFVEESGGSLPSFFGFLQKMDRYLPGLVFAFGMYTTDGDLKDQNDLLENKQLGSLEIKRFHRTSNHRASTFVAGAAVGYRLAPNFSIGFGANYIAVDELTQEYQDVYQTKLLNDGTTGYQVLGQNIRQRLTAFGIEPMLGVQVAFLGSLSLGLTLKQGIIASQKFDVGIEHRTTLLLAESVPDLDASNPITTSTKQIIRSEANDNPLGSWPTTARLGVAWFASTTFMMAFDVVHKTAVEDAGEIDSFLGKKVFEKQAVTNVALGMEYYLFPAFPIRLGVFTNQDARPKVEEGKAGQPDHIDYIGETLFVAWVQPNSQISAGIILQQGQGKAQKLGDDTIQDVEATANTFAFSATHNL